ncbi:protein EOLA1-like [Ptychodera flava]|uniref:protein EOLA1-like n=1 Tax=Ptychodera flava TaxID=63121 RepID=UPI00396A50BD
MPKSKRRKHLGRNHAKETVANSENQSHEDGQPTKTFVCISARQPYAGFILNGLKTIETRWTQVFKNLENKTVAVHVAWNEWEGQEWKDILKERGLEEMEIEDLLESGKKHGRGVIAGVFTVGESWKCEAETLSEGERQDLEKQAILRPLDGKYLTRIYNPVWLIEPMKCRGQPGVWHVEIPESSLPV